MGCLFSVFYPNNYFNISNYMSTTTITPQVKKEQDAYDWWYIKSHKFGNLKPDEVAHWVVMFESETEGRFVTYVSEQGYNYKHVALERPLKVYTVDTTRANIEVMCCELEIIKVMIDGVIRAA
jgi:hypothetical protein